MIQEYLDRAMALHAVGYASRADIDLAMRLGCGLPAGPFEMLGVSSEALAPPPPLDAAGARTVHRIGVLGSGTMATGIAEVAARAGYATVLVSRDPERARAASARIARRLDKAVGRCRLTAAAAADTMGRLVTGADRTALAPCDLVVEAVAEDPAVKDKVFRELDWICRPGAVLATTTSSLSVAACAAATDRPEEVVGMHFFNPAPMMRLVELIRTAKTPPGVLATAAAVCGQLGKTPVVCDDRPGFIVNYLLFPYLNSAIRLLEGGGTTAKDIDDAVTHRYGFPMGPFALLDVVGLDVSLAIQQTLHLAYPGQALDAATMLGELVAGGRLGRKNGLGFHSYG
nr:3-hydroxyacyl-CoA dehydrogenase family protein [Micromonospora tarapacensis]